MDASSQNSVLESTYAMVAVYMDYVSVDLVRVNSCVRYETRARSCMSYGEASRVHFKSMPYHQSRCAEKVGRMLSIRRQSRVVVSQGSDVVLPCKAVFNLHDYLVEIPPRG